MVGVCPLMCTVHLCGRVTAAAELTGVGAVASFDRALDRDPGIRIAPQQEELLGEQVVGFLVRAVGPRIQTWINGRKIEDLVDPDRELSEDERLRRAEQARKAHFAQLALKSSRARQRARGNGHGTATT
jgi:hypothetical protein